MLSKQQSCSGDTASGISVLTCLPACNMAEAWCRALVLGGLKTGRKRLFIQEGGPFIQIQPVCVLDFYVHEDYQRQGVGFQLFEVWCYPCSFLPM